jgi:hypothetical protein
VFGLQGEQKIERFRQFKQRLTGKPKEVGAGEPVGRQNSTQAQESAAILTWNCPSMWMVRGVLMILLSLTGRQVRQTIHFDNRHDLRGQSHSVAEVARRVLSQFQFQKGNQFIAVAAHPRPRQLPAETQIALLRVLQDREFERVGGTQRVRANVRLVAATNRDLAAEIGRGNFRADLFYRLNVFPSRCPPFETVKKIYPF